MPVAAAIPALIGAAGAIGGALIASSAAKKAAATESAAANKSIDTQLAIYADTKGNLQPFTDIGKSASYTLADLFGLPSPGNPGGSAGFNAAYQQFQNSPSYQFPYQQGLKAVDQSAASKGMLLSGNQLQAVTNYGQGYASSQLGNFVTGLQDLANRGENAGAQSGQIGLNVGANVGNTILDGANAQAAGTLGAAAAWNNGLFGSNGLTSDLSQLYRATYGTPSAYTSTNPAATSTTASPATYTGYAMGP